MKSVLIIDDSVDLSLLMRESFSSAGYDVVGETGLEKEAIRLALKLKPDIIILDNVLNDMFGIDVLMKLNKEELHTKIIMTGTESQNKLITMLKNFGASDYIRRPYQMDHLIDTAKKASGVSQVA